MKEEGAVADAAVPAAERSGGTSLRGPFTVVWFVLIGATLLSWYLGADHGFQSHTATSIVVILVAFVKVRFVGLYFMDLRDAPILLRSIFEVYCVVACTLLIALCVAA
jgi:heme/copper-type cytochrome/quinol oxidase subunit 4